jgi:hypothetical protein
MRTGRGAAPVRTLAAAVAVVVTLVAFNKVTPRIAGTAVPGAADGRTLGSTGVILNDFGRFLHPADELLRKSVTASAEGPPGIVRAVGTHLVLNGEPWRFLGFNAYQVTSRSYAGYTCGGAHSDQEVDSDFARMHELGVTVVRTWFFQSYVAGRSWAAFDRVLADAARHQIRVIPVLTNQWGSCEDYDRTPLQYKALGWYQSGYRTDLSYGLPLPYRDFAVGVARHYAGDPRVAFWQLVNEAEAADSPGGPCQEAAAAATLRGFADDMAESIKKADPAHLVSLGTVGGGQCGTAGSDYQLVHAGAIDLCEAHDYVARPQQTPRPNPCLALHKPMFIGERGFTADVGRGATSAATLRARAAYVQTDIANTFAADGCDGYLLWSWASGPSVSYDIGAGDPVGPVLRRLSTTVATPLAVYVAVWSAARGGPQVQSDH